MIVTVALAVGASERRAPIRKTLRLVIGRTVIATAAISKGDFNIMLYWKFPISGYTCMFVCYSPIPLDSTEIKELVKQEKLTFSNILDVYIQ